MIRIKKNEYRERVTGAYRLQLCLYVSKKSQAGTVQVHIYSIHVGI